MPHLFTYGSLMFEQVFSKLIAHEYQKSTATLRGFIRKAVVNERYPVVYRNEASDRVDGVVYFELMDRDLRRLDAFEGDFYQRQQETIVIPEGREICAEVYVVKDCYRHIASGIEWDPERFFKKA